MKSTMPEKRKRKLLREQSLILPEVENPFVHRFHLTTLDKIQIAVMSVTIVPLRLLAISLMLILAWTVAFIAMAGRTTEGQKEPMSGWRSWSRPLVVLFSRAVFFAAGFHWIVVKGKRASSTVAPVVALGPHSSYIDALPVVSLQLTTVVAKSQTRHIPIFGTLIRYTQPVFVSREDPNSRLNTIKEIQRRAQSKGKWPQIIIFPEGTCTNRSCLIAFKPGAFYPGVPVQPVVLRYRNKLDTVTWTWQGLTGFQVLWYTLCQFHNSLEIEFLPVYTPTEEEKNDAKLYAANVRQKMAECLGVPVTDHTFEDCRLMLYAANLDLPAAAGLVETHKLRKKLGLNYDNLKDQLERFCKIAQNNESGEVTLEQFAKFLDLPVSEPLREMFDIYDRDGSGTIDFREYVIGMSLYAMPANNEETLALAFKLFDHGGKGYITQQELSQILYDAFDMEEVDASALFQQVDTDADGKITYEELKNYAAQKPEYAQLFTTYQEMKARRESQLACDTDTGISNGQAKVKTQ